MEDRRNVGESSCNSGVGTDRRVQSLMFMVMMMMLLETPNICRMFTHRQGKGLHRGRTDAVYERKVTRGKFKIVKRIYVAGMKLNI